MEMHRNDGGAEIGVLYTAPETPPDMEHHLGGILPISRLNYHKEIDIALLQVSLMEWNGEPVTLPALRLSPGLPEVGDVTFTFGYTHWSAVVRNEAHLHIDAELMVRASRGFIQEVYPLRRDNSMLTFPCFRLDARYDSGMSGGPVFSAKRGGVIGVVCSSHGKSPDNQHTSYASLVVPALALQVLAVHQGVEQELSLYRYMQDGVVAVDDTFADVEVSQSESGSMVEYGYPEEG